MDDEIARRMISGFASSKKAYAPKPKALSSPYTSSKHHPCDRQERSSPTPMATLSTPMSTMVLDREAALDDISDALNHCSSQVYSGWHLLLDKQRMLGNQVNHIAELLPSVSSKSSSKTLLTNGSFRLFFVLCRGISQTPTFLPNLIEKQWMNQQAFLT
jgi:hypothetical protein